MPELKLSEQFVDRLASLVFGCSGLGLGLGTLGVGTVATLGVPALIGAGTAIGLAVVAGQRHAVESKASLRRIRTQVEKEFRQSVAFDSRANQASMDRACSILDTFLRQVMLPPIELARAAHHPSGAPFPTLATQIVMTKLLATAQEAGEPFDPMMEEFARAVISTAFHAAVVDKAYFAQLQPHLQIEAARVAGRALGVIEQVASAVARIETRVVESNALLEEHGNKLDAATLERAALSAQLTSLALSVQSLGLSRERVLELARAVNSKISNFDEAVRELQYLVGVARDYLLSGGKGDALDEFVKGVLARARTLSFPDGADEIDLALSRLERDRADASSRVTQIEQGQLALLEAGIAQDILAMRPQAAATKEIARIRISTPQHAVFAALSSAQETHYVTGLDKGIRLELEMSVCLCREALHECSRERDPLSWATAQNNLGNTLVVLGGRLGGYDGDAFLAEAVEAHRATLTVRTRADMPADWAAAQLSLGLSLRILGAVLIGEEREPRFAEAVELCRRALEVYTRADMPVEWATAQHHLGDALLDLGDVPWGYGKTSLVEAVEALRAALTVRTRADMPADWAAAQHSLGNALFVLSGSLDGEDRDARLAEAVEAYRAALTVRTRADMPVLWAYTQGNLGTTLKVLGMRGGGEEEARRLAEAVELCRSALEVHSRADMPVPWAMAQKNLAAALWVLGDHLGGEEGAGRFAEAVAAYRASLEVYTLTDMPVEWGWTQRVLGDALNARAELLDREGGRDLDGAGDVARLAEAVEASRGAVECYRRAIDGFTRFASDKADVSAHQFLVTIQLGRSRSDWAVSLVSLGRRLIALGERLGGDDGAARVFEGLELLRHAAETSIAAGRTGGSAAGRTGRGALALKLKDLGDRLGGAAGAALLTESVEHYRSLAFVYASEEDPNAALEAQHRTAEVLSALGQRLDGADGVAQLTEVVEIYRGLLEVRTRADMPAAWAMAQSILGHSLQTLGKRLGGEEGVARLMESAAAFHNALEVYTRADWLWEWVAAQNNLRIALHLLGERLGGVEGLKYLREAVSAASAAIEGAALLAESFEHDRVPLEHQPRWANMLTGSAALQNNLGIALHLLGERLGGVEGLKYLREAVSAVSVAIEVFEQIGEHREAEEAREFLANTEAVVAAFSKQLG